MALINIQIPAMGEGITEAEITRLLKKVGDKIEIDEALVEIATDKVDTEILATHNGKVEKILFKEGDIAQVGATVIVLATEGDNSDTFIENKTDVLKPEEANIVEINSELKQKKDKDILHISKTPSGKTLSPLVRSIAKNENLTASELDKIKGSGAGNRITKNDILNFIEQEKNRSDDKLKNQTSSQTSELVKMDRMRKLIADHMISSKKTSAHVTSFVEVDVTNIVNWRTSIKKEYQKKYGENLTYTPIFTEAIVQAIIECPGINVSVEGDSIRYKKEINIGMATALPNGNLIVPVIKSANTLNLQGLSKKVNDLANRARNNKLKPDEIQDGTFTITNVGSFGNLTGTPIINQPEVAIIALGMIKKRPAVIETPQGDTIGIRHIMIISMSYDHRVIDGALGGMFLKRVGELLENFDIKRKL